MTQAYFIIPNLLYPSKDLLLSETEKSLTSLKALLKGAEEPISQTLCEAHQSGSVDLAWCWKVLTRSKETFATAPYRWLMHGGPRLAGEIWRLNLLSLNNDAVCGFFNPTEEAIEKISFALRAPLSQAGFVLQRWDASLYLTRKTPWDVTTREAETLLGKSISEADFSSLKEGASKAAWSVLTDLNTRLKALAIDGADALWIDGGGKLIDFYPPTQIRSVLADDDAILGWADASGILSQRMGKATGAASWPKDAPNGAVIAVLSQLKNPEITPNTKAWEKALTALTDSLTLLKEAARKRGCDEALIVACGKRMTKTFTVKLTNPKSLLARFTRSKEVDVVNVLNDESDTQ